MSVSEIQNVGLVTASSSSGKINLGYICILEINVSKAINFYAQLFIKILWIMAISSKYLCIALKKSVQKLKANFRAMGNKNPTYLFNIAK